MKLAHFKPRINPPDKSNPTPTSKQASKIQPKKQVCQWILELASTTNQIQKTKAIREIVTLCYSNWTNQFYLCNNLKIPFREGPISITEVPEAFKDRANQICNLFKYLKKVRESYICWMIYLDYELGVLNLKLLTQFELMELNNLYESGEIMVGMFIGKQYFSKTRTISTKTNFNKFFTSTGLTTKTTKDSLNEKHTKSNKSLKSVSMKQKKNLKHDFSQKLLGQSFNNHHKRVDMSESSFKGETGNKSTSSIHTKNKKSMNLHEKKKSIQGSKSFKLG